MKHLTLNVALGMVDRLTASIAGSIAALGALSMAISFLFYPVARIILGIGHFTGVNTLLSESLKKVSAASLTANKHLFSVKGAINALSATKTAFTTKSMALIQIAKNARNLSFWLKGLKTLFSVAFSPIKMIFMGIGSAISLILSPIGLLVAALAGAGIYIYIHWEKVKVFFGGFFTELKIGL